jgi:hypothetical protein
MVSKNTPKSNSKESSTNKNMYNIVIIRLFILISTTHVVVQTMSSIKYQRIYNMAGLL